MATETERKFLVKGEFRHLAAEKKKIVQSYLASDAERTVRLRIADDEAFLTIKSKAKQGTLTRNEWEFAIPLSDAESMMQICLPGRVIKTRFIVPYGGHIFEVDVFHERNEGLIIAELELSSEAEEYEKPEWLGEEVTGDPRYYNSYLAGRD